MSQTKSSPAKGKMTTAQKAKSLGLKSLKQAVDLGWPRSTLADMYRNRPDRFEVVILGCVAKLGYITI